MEEAAERTVQIVAAHPLEVKELRKSLGCGSSTATSGEFILQDTRVGIVICGVGQEQIGPTINPLFQEEKIPSLIFNVGFVGALDSKIDWGSWILCDKIYRLDQGHLHKDFFISHPLLLKKAQQYLYERNIQGETGSLITADKAYPDSGSKKRLFGRTKAAAVDMEAYYLAQIAAEKKVPFLSVKIVSDAVRDFASDAIKSRGRILSHRIAEIVPDLIIRLVN